jgi:hypothetical protein
MVRTCLLVPCWTAVGAGAAFAQDGFEIQVYASETVPPGRTMVELHSNFTARGERQTVNGVEPTWHSAHETLEVTHGFTDCFELGGYLFTSIQPDDGFEYVGNHIRPRIRAPDDWQWPVGASLSMEVGYARRSFSEDTWSLELRPIVDKQCGRLYLAFNPVLEASFHGENAGHGFDFSPCAKVSFAATESLALGVEYYASLGSVEHFESWNQQQHQVFAVADLDLGPVWEVDFGVGFGLTDSTDDLVFKLIVGRRF